MPKKGNDILNQLVENNITLQKKTTELLMGMNALTKRMSDLVGIFEEAAKRVKPGMEDEELRPLIDKLQVLLDQNKNIAKGLVLLEGYVRENERKSNSFQPRPLSPE